MYLAICHKAVTTVSESFSSLPPLIQSAHANRHYATNNYQQHEETGPQNQTRPDQTTDTSTIKDENSTQKQLTALLLKSLLLPGGFADQPIRTREECHEDQGADQDHDDVDRDLRVAETPDVHEAVRVLVRERASHERVRTQPGSAGRAPASPT